MRIDRAITLGLAAPWQRLARPAPGLPILMYHSVSDRADRRAHPYYWTNTRPALFAGHMEALAHDGYRALPLAEALQAPPGAKVVAITFDDGYEDIFTTVAPILRAHGFTATVFLPAGFIGEPRRMFNDRPGLTWSEIRALRQDGLHFGSHTMSHPELVRLPPEQVRAELADSRRVISEALREEVDFFAYPYAFPSADRAFVDQFRRIARACGYRAAVTTVVGRVRAGDDPFTLKRLPINSGDDLCLFRAKLKGAYDWMRSAQTVFKGAKRWIP